MSAAIRFERVSKKFILHHQRSRSLQELMMNLVRGQEDSQQEEFWSLNQVNLEIAPGETVGLIGPNGAGKSTIMKLIARIIRPTSGRIEINGQVGALLELGSGFHPDMTGRENIYLNGSILGMSQAQIRRKLDEIITFAELERFIDLPVRNYSSGMYVRLGFSVAVHTEPNILLIDEVLAVGDAAFQRKCLDKIDQLRREGVTILFVSHSLDSVQQICKRAVWVDLGRIIADGSADSIVKQYVWHTYEANPVAAIDPQERRWGNGKVKIERVRLLNGNGLEQSTFKTNEPLTIQIHYRAPQPVEQPVFGLAIHRSDGSHLTGPNTQYNNYEIPLIDGPGIIEYQVSRLPLLEGTYYISVVACSQSLSMAEVFDFHDQLYPFRVYHGQSQERLGLIALNGTWANKTADQPPPLVVPANSHISSER